ncbi:hypothetical protein HPHPP25_0336 [Helicobacter pylori Hp P-25]|nr:hypothetical protein HPHPP25_0336 [Helicobacter pylori Hp P-25]
MVKERPEEARNSLKGNFYFFFSSLGEFGGVWLSFIFCFLFSFLFSFILSLFLLKFQNNV